MLFDKVIERSVDMKGHRYSCGGRCRGGSWETRGLNSFTKFRSVFVRWNLNANFEWGSLRNIFVPKYNSQIPEQQTLVLYGVHLSLDRRAISWSRMNNPESAFLWSSALELELWGAIGS